MEAKTILFSLLRSVICDQTPPQDVLDACTQENLQDVYRLARKHNVAHLVAHALEGSGRMDRADLPMLKQAKLQAIYHYAQLDYELERICGTLENARIPYIPLKGSVLRQYYPEPWMRTSGDIDVLVPEQDLDRACACLEAELGYENKKRAYHDVTFRTPGGVILELHFILAEESQVPKAKKFVDGVWEYTVPMQEKHYGRLLTPEMLYFYHILHMVHHFYAGGFGVRFLLDHYIIRTKLDLNDAHYVSLLKESGLYRFAEAIDDLSDVWFRNGAHTPLTRDIEQMILSGGTFGSVENQAAVKQSRQGGRLQSILSKIILPYDQLKGLYPILREKKWLTPLFQFVRWFRLLSPERWKRSMVFLKASIHTDSEKADSIHDLMKDLEL